MRLITKFLTSTVILFFLTAQLQRIANFKLKLTIHNNKLQKKIKNKTQILVKLKYFHIKNIIIPKMRSKTLFKAENLEFIQQSNSI